MTSPSQAASVADVQEAQGTTCDQPIEAVNGTEFTNIVRVPFRDGECVSHFSTSNLNPFQSICLGMLGVLRTMPLHFSRPPVLPTHRVDYLHSAWIAQGIQSELYLSHPVVDLQRAGLGGTRFLPIYHCHGPCTYLRIYQCNCAIAVRESSPRGRVESPQYPSGNPIQLSSL